MEQREEKDTTPPVLEFGLLSLRNGNNRTLTSPPREVNHTDCSSAPAYYSLSPSASLRTLASQF